MIVSIALQPGNGGTDPTAELEAAREQRVRGAVVEHVRDHHRGDDPEDERALPMVVMRFSGRSSR
jgi:hypothetical protein